MINVLKFKLFSNNMFEISTGNHKMLVRMANSEDFDQIASLEAVLSGSALFVYAYLAGS